MTLILVLTIILLITREWTEIKGFTDYLTAAGTMTSLVLGVLAIIYSFVSSREQSDILSNIGSSSRNITDIASKLGQLTSSATEIQDKSAARTETLLQIIEKLGYSVSTLEKHTQDLSNNSLNISNKITDVQARLDEIKAEQQFEAPPQPGAESFWTDDRISSTLETYSLLGLCSINLVALGLVSASKSVNLTTYCNLSGISNSSYLKGYIFGLDASSLIDVIGMTMDDGYIFKCKAIANNNIHNLIENEWLRRTKKATKLQEEKWLKYREAMHAAVH